MIRRDDFIRLRDEVKQKKYDALKHKTIGDFYQKSISGFSS